MQNLLSVCVTYSVVKVPPKFFEAVDLATSFEINGLILKYEALLAVNYQKQKLEKNLRNKTSQKDRKSYCNAGIRTG